MLIKTTTGIPLWLRLHSHGANRGPEKGRRGDSWATAARTPIIAVRPLTSSWRALKVDPGRDRDAGSTLPDGWPPRRVERRIGAKQNTNRQERGICAGQTGSRTFYLKKQILFGKWNNMYFMDFWGIKEGIVRILRILSIYKLQTVSHNYLSQLHRVRKKKQYRKIFGANPACENIRNSKKICKPNYLNESISFMFCCLQGKKQSRKQFHQMPEVRKADSKFSYTIRHFYPPTNLF